MPENQAQFTEMFEVQVRTDTFAEGLLRLEKAYDEFLVRIGKKGVSGKEVIDVSSLGAVSQGLKELSGGFTQARNDIVESLRIMSQSMVESLNAVGDTIDKKLKSKAKEAGEEIENAAEKMQKLLTAIDEGGKQGNISSFSNQQQTKAFEELYPKISGDSAYFDKLSEANKKWYDGQVRRIESAVQAKEAGEAKQEAIDKKAELAMAQHDATLENKQRDHQAKMERDIVEHDARMENKLRDHLEKEKMALTQHDAWRENRARMSQKEAESQLLPDLNRFLLMSPAQQAKTAVEGGWKGQGSATSAEYEKQSESMRKIVENAKNVRNTVSEVEAANKKAAAAAEEHHNVWERFWGKMTSRMPEFIAQIIRYSFGFQILFGIINAIQQAILSPIAAMKQGITYLTAMQDRMADIKEALLENVRFSKDWADNTSLAGKAAEVATQSIMKVSAQMALQPEKVEAGFKALIQGGGLKMMNGDLTQGVELTAKLISLMRSRGVSETNQRRAVTEINNLMTGQVKESSVLLQVLNLTTAQWHKVREEARQTGDLLGTHVTATETLRDRLSAVDDRLAGAQNRWKDLSATLEQYKNMFFGAFSGPLFSTFIEWLKKVKAYFEEHKGQVLAIANNIGVAVANMAKLVFQFGAAHTPFLRLVTMAGQMAVHIESALDSYLTLDEVISQSNDKTSAVQEEGDAKAKEFEERRRKAMDLRGDARTQELAKIEQDSNNYLHEFAQKLAKAESQDVGNVQSLRAEYTKRMDDRAKRWQQLEELTHEELAPDAGSKWFQQQAATAKANADRVETSLKAAKATNADAESVKNLTEQLKNLRSQEAAFNAAAKANAASEMQPTIIDYIDKATSSTTGDKPLTKLLSEYKSEIEDIHAAEDQYRSDTKRYVQERQISVKEGEERIIASLEREKQKLHEVSNEYAQKGKQYASDKGYSRYVTALDTTKADNATYDQVNAAKNAITKDEQDRTRALNAWQEHEEVAHQRRMLSILQAEVSEGTRTKLDALYAEQELRRREHQELLNQYTQELRTAEANADGQAQAGMKIVSEMRKYADESITLERKISKAKIEEADDARKFRLKVAQDEYRALQDELQLQQQGGLTITEQADNRIKLAKAYERLIEQELIDAKIKLLELAQNGATNEQLIEQARLINDITEAKKRAAGETGQAERQGSAGGVLSRQIFGKDDLHNDEGTGAFDGFKNSVESMGEAFKFFQGTVSNLVSAWKQGYAQGGTAGGIGGVMGQVGGMMSMIPGIGGAIGAGLQIGGAILGWIGGLFKAAARRIAEEIKKAFDKTMKDYERGSSTLVDTIGKIQQERVDAIRRLSNKKGGKEELDKLLPELDDALYSLLDKQRQIISDFESTLVGLRYHNEVISDFVSKWTELNQKVKEYVEAGGDIAKASEYMSLSLEKLKESYGADLREGEQQAIQDAINLNDLLKQRVDLINEWKQTEFDLRTKDAEERRRSNAVVSGTELAKKRKEFQDNLDNLNSQIDLAQKKIDKEKELWSISSDIAELHRRDAELELQNLDEEMKRYKAMYVLVNGISMGANGQFSISKELADSLGLGGILDVLYKKPTDSNNYDALIPDDVKKKFEMYYKALSMGNSFFANFIKNFGDLQKWMDWFPDYRPSGYGSSSTTSTNITVNVTGISGDPTSVGNAVAQAIAKEIEYSYRNGSGTNYGG